MRKIVITAYFPNANRLNPETVDLTPDQAAAIPLVGDRFGVSTLDGVEHWKVTERSFSYTADEIHIHLTCAG